MTRLPVYDVDRLDCRLKPHRWRYAETHRAAMDELWARRVAENPSLYDGAILLAHRIAPTRAADGARVLEVDLFQTTFSRFLAWRDLGWPDASVYNCFAMPAVRARDGGYLVGEMAASHSSAGHLYFPAGTPDLSDVRDDGGVDFVGSIRRELREETGLDALPEALAPGWTIVEDGQRIACIRRIDWDATGRVLADEVQAFIASEAQPELARAEILTHRAQLGDPRLLPFMIAYLGAVLPERE